MLFNKFTKFHVVIFLIYKLKKKYKIYKNFFFYFINKSLRRSSKIKSINFISEISNFRKSLSIEHNDKGKNLSKIYYEMKKEIPSPVLFSKIKNRNVVTYSIDDNEFHPNFPSSSIKLIILSILLPIKIKQISQESLDISNKYEISLIKNPFKTEFTKQLYSYIRKEFQNINWIGFIENQEEIEEMDKKEIIRICEKKFNCTPIFVESYQIEKFKFYCNLINEIFHNCYDIKEIEKIKLADDEIWSNFMILNRIFVDKAMEIIENEETMQLNHFFFICNYELIFCSSLLAQRNLKIPIGIFYDEAFPVFDNFRIFPQCKEIINSILCADLIWFSNFQHAKPFFNAIYEIYGIK